MKINWKIFSLSLGIGLILAVLFLLLLGFPMWYENQKPQLIEGDKN